MRIAQITDIHIGHPDERPHGINARDQFLRTLDTICSWEPDHIVLSGDLCFREPDDIVYEWIAGQLEALPCEVTVIAGNHDSQLLIQRHFDTFYHEATDEIYGNDILGDTQVFFLDTARGLMSETQYNWFDDQLDRNASRIMIFMHHPPLYCGVPHMDEQYAFREIPRVQRVFQGVNSELYIFCGHYHVDRVIRHANQLIHITPSTYFQIDSSIVEFGIDHHRPGFRMIEIDPDGIVSSCLYMD